MELADFCWSNKINNKKSILESKHLQLEVPLLSEWWWRWLSSTLFHAMLSAFRYERWEKTKIKGTLMASLIICLYRQRTLEMPKALQIFFRQECQKISFCEHFFWLALCNSWGLVLSTQLPSQRSPGCSCSPALNLLSWGVLMLQYAAGIFLNVERLKQIIAIL